MQVQEELSSPDCSYEVLAGGIQGQVVKFANIGDILVHKWTCETGLFALRAIFKVESRKTGNPRPLVLRPGRPWKRVPASEREGVSF